MSRRCLTLASAAAATIALAACSSSGSAHHSAGATHHAVTTTRQTSKACAALPTFDHATLTYPGAGDTKPTYLGHPQFEGFEVIQTVGRGAK